MKQLFSPGEPAILQSLDAPQYWNRRVVVKSVCWMENPMDIHGMPTASTFVYEIDICEGRFAQQTLRKLNEPHIVIREQSTNEIML